MDHFQEPWGLSVDGLMVRTPPSEVILAAIKGSEAVTVRRICVCEPGHYLNESECRANARRIVAAVNACAGIPTEALEAMAKTDALGVLWREHRAAPKAPRAREARASTVVVVDAPPDPARECSMCSGEYCEVHGVRAWPCDTAERHGDRPCPLLGPDAELAGVVAIDPEN